MRKAQISSKVAASTRREITRRWHGRGTLVIGAVLAVAACGGAGGEPPSGAELASTTTLSNPTTITNPPTTSPTTPTTTTLPATTTTRAEPESNVAVGEVFTGEAQFFNVVEPSVALTAEDPWKLLELHRGVVLLQDPELVTQFTRAVLLVDAAPIGAETIDEWAPINADVTLQSRTETEVGGIDAVVYDITYDGEGDLPFLSLSSSFNQGRIIVRSSEYYRVWDVNTGDEKRLFVFVPVLPDDIDWLDRAESLVSTIELSG